MQSRDVAALSHFFETQLPGSRAACVVILNDKGQASLLTSGPLMEVAFLSKAFDNFVTDAMSGRLGPGAVETKDSGMTLVRAPEKED
jgi:hypothetical protein